MSDLAMLTFDGSIGTLTLNRASSRNALSIDLLAALHARLDEIATRTDLIALILTGAGPSFCAGMDLKQVLNEPGAPLRLLSSLAELTLKLRALPLVTIASVNGAAIGGGCGIVTVCDLAITHADSKMGFPEVDLGVCPAVVAPWLAKRIGHGAARRLLLMGGTFSGRDAHVQGIVSHLVESREALHAGSLALAQRVSQGGPIALRATKALLNQLDGSSLAADVRRGADLSASVIDEPLSKQHLKSKLGL